MTNRYLYNFNIVPLGPRIRPFYRGLHSLRAGSHYNRTGLWWYLFIRTPSYLYESNKMCVVIIVQNRHCWTITLWVTLLLVYCIKLAGVQDKVWNPPPRRKVWTFGKRIVAVEFYFLTIYTYLILCIKYWSYRNTKKNATKIWV